MFELLMESYKSMNQLNKKKALINEIKKMVDVLQNTCIEKGIRFREINLERIDLDNENEYLEFVFAYMMYLEELLGSYLQKTLE